MKYLLLLITCLCCRYSHGQVVSFKDSVATYNHHRISINKTGMKVLGSWGLVNLAAGGIGYFTATKDEWKYFHEMNALWGVVNTGLAAMGMAGARKEMNARLNANQSYNRYLANKRLYLINAGLDVVYIGVGVGLNEYGRNTGNDKAIFQGFGKSIAIQGIFLLLFDNIMFAAHSRSNTKWFTLMNEIRLSNSGIGFIHTF